MIDFKKLPRTEFAAAVAQIAGERRIDPQTIIESVKLAIVAAYKKDARERGEEIDPEAKYAVELNPESGLAKIFLVGEDGQRQEVTPPDFGRIAAQTAKQVIIQKIREAEKEAIFAEFANRIGTLVNGVVLRTDGPRVIVGVGKAEAVMPREERIPGEKYVPPAKMVFYLKEICEDDGHRTMIVSRAAPQLVEELFRREVPEVAAGSVEIARIARRPGKRTKIAVQSHQNGVDPVGSCVGQEGARVHVVMDELGGEKIDIIPFSQDIKQLVKAALAPAENITIKKIDDKKKVIEVEVPEEELARTIGVRGENVELAGELVGYEIEVGPAKAKKAKTKAKPAPKEETKKAAKKKEAAEKEAKGKKKVAKAKKDEQK